MRNHWIYDDECTVEKKTESIYVVYIQSFSLPFLHKSFPLHVRQSRKINGDELI